MVRSFSIALFVVLLVAFNALAGFDKGYRNLLSNENAVAPIQIKGKGIYNLIISIQFLNEPYDKKIYKSETYKLLINRLQVEWTGIALQKVLEANEQNLDDFVKIKSSIETEIEKLADQLKQKYLLEKDVEVVFSISNFFLLEPRWNKKWYNPGIIVPR